MRPLLLGGELVEKLGLVRPLVRERLQPTGYHLGLSDEYCVLRDTGDIVEYGDVLDCDSLRRIAECGRFDRLVLEPGRYYLLISEEELNLPPDVAAFVQLRSTAARLGIITPSTFIDPGFRGRLVIEVTSVVRVALRPRDAIIHVNFIRVDGGTLGGYTGIYQGQDTIRVRNCEVWKELALHAAKKRSGGVW